MKLDEILYSEYEDQSTKTSEDGGLDPIETLCTNQ